MGVAGRHGHWTIRYVDERGREIRRVVRGAVTKSQAEERLREELVRIDRIKAGLELRERNPKKLLVSDVARDLREARAVPQFTQLVRDYIEETDLGAERLERVTTAMLRVHLDGVKPKSQRIAKLGPESMNHIRTALIAVFRRAIDRGELIGENPALRLKKQKVPKRAMVTLTVDEVTTVLAIAKPPWSMMIAGALLGLRKGELFGLDVADVDQERWELHVHRSHSKPKTKTGQNRMVPVHPALRPFIASAIEASKGGVLFPGRKRSDGTYGRRHPESHTGRALDALLLEAGITRHLRWHDLRHTAATLMLQAGAPIAHVSKIVGHSSIAVTADRYGHLVTEDLRSAMERVPFKIKPKAVGE